MNELVNGSLVARRLGRGMMAESQVHCRRVATVAAVAMHIELKIDVHRMEAACYNRHLCAVGGPKLHMPMEPEHIGKA